MNTDGIQASKLIISADRQASGKAKASEQYLDKIKGSLLGGAMGDALGYPVEFLRESDILTKYGSKGITCYEKDVYNGKALISDDTQMTLFTANGILVGETRLRMDGIEEAPSAYVPIAYQDWLITQKTSYLLGKDTRRQYPESGISWLLDVPALYCQRAPGMTCLSALRNAKRESCGADYIAKPRNNSKGCGGIMRIAPLALHYKDISMAELDKEGAILSAITHGHPLGYMPSAVLTHILHGIVYPKGQPATLKELIIEAKNALCELFKGTEYLDELCAIVLKAIALSENKESDSVNIKHLGEGWVAEEALAISLYCSLRYEHDFSGGIIAAVNHDGDSDSTGAITGNILGAICGYEAIEDKWKADLELSEVLLEMAEDLYHGCQISEGSSFVDPDWVQKYIQMHWEP